MIICENGVSNQQKNSVRNNGILIGKTIFDLKRHFEQGYSRLWTFKQMNTCIYGEGRLEVWYCYRNKWDARNQKVLDEEEPGFRQDFYILDGKWQLEIIQISRNIDLTYLEGLEDCEYNEIKYTLVNENEEPTGDIEIQRFFCWKNNSEITGTKLLHVIHDDPNQDKLYEFVFTDTLWQVRNQLFNEPKRPWWDVRYDMFTTD
jgi:hypothetical protein